MKNSRFSLYKQARGRGTAPASLYGSLGVKPGKICKMDYKKIHLTYLVRGDVKRDVVSKKYRDTLRKRIEAVVDTISPLYGNGFTQAHWKWCACIRITAILRTAKAFDLKRLIYFVRLLSSNKSFLCSAARRSFVAFRQTLNLICTTFLPCVIGSKDMFMSVNSLISF